MARIAGVDLPKNKRMDIALTAIFGIGRKVAKIICEKAGVDGSVRSDAYSDADIQKIRRVIDADYKVEGDLRREIAMNIKRYIDMQCYRGIRHRKGLPVNGQRTHTNARTRKGRRRGLGQKKKVSA